MSDDLRNRVARAIEAAFAEHTEIASLSDAVADAMADAALAEMGGVRVRELAWDDNEVMAGGVMTYGSALSPFGRYYLTETGWFGPGIIHSHQPDRETAKADVKADYEARILAAIEPAPVSVREAARVLCGSTETPFLEPASAITKGLKNHGYLVPVRILHKELRAIAEGGCVT